MSKGNHTWDLFLHYYQCPKCGFIMANRTDYDYKLAGVFEKKLICNRCAQCFTVVKVHKNTLSSYLGTGQPIEMEWKE